MRLKSLFDTLLDQGHYLLRERSSLAMFIYPFIYFFCSQAKTINGTLEEHQLFLHPNLSTEGVWGRSNANGLLLVLVCGTLHHRTAHQCLGVFENLFLLAQDPFAADNWKIKSLEAILRSRPQVHQPLTIQESELALTLQ